MPGHTLEKCYVDIYLFINASTFFYKDSEGVHHLKRLSSSGLTHVHLLPSFHFADVADEKDKWKNAGNIPLSLMSAFEVPPIGSYP